MILKLLQINLRSDWALILAAAAVSLVLWDAETNPERPATFATLIYGQWPFLVLLPILEARNSMQKRRRLLGQLPVRGLSVQISQWLSTLVIILVPCAISAVMVSLYPIVPRPIGFTIGVTTATVGWDLIAAVGLLIIAVLLSLVAIARIFVQINALPKPWKFAGAIVCFIGTMALCEQWLIFFHGTGLARVDGPINWPVALSAALGSALALIVFDILLDRYADNHLR